MYFFIFLFSWNLLFIQFLPVLFIYWSFLYFSLNIFICQDISIIYLDLLNIFIYYHNFLFVFFLALLLQVIDLVKNNKPICFTFLITDNLILVLF